MAANWPLAEKRRLDEDRGQMAADSTSPVRGLQVLESWKVQQTAPKHTHTHTRARARTHTHTHMHTHDKKFYNICDVIECTVLLLLVVVFYYYYVDQ